MPTPTLWQLMEAVASQVKDRADVRSEPEIVSRIEPPFLQVGVPPIPNYRAAFGRGTVLLEDWPLYVLTSSRMDRVGQKLLADLASWTGQRSIPLALEYDKTLGGLAMDLIVTSFRPLGLDEVGVIGYYGGEFRLTVQVNGQE